MAQALCRLAELPDGAARLIDTSDPSESLILLRSGDAVHAFRNRCPHFGVPLAKHQRHLLFTPHESLSCNNHYARFRWQDGVCEYGDCEGEALQTVGVEVIDGEICLAV